MPNIPTHSRQITPKPVGTSPLPVQAADAGAGHISAGLAQLGVGISNIGESLLKIEQEKQKLRDNASLASASGDYDKAVADKINEARRTVFTSIEQFGQFRRQASIDLDNQVNSSIEKMSRDAGSRFGNFAITNKQTALRQIEGIVWQKEIEFGQADTLRQYSNKFEVLAGAGVPLEDILKDPSLNIIETGMSPYWKAGDLARARDRTLIDSLVNVARYKDAKDLTQSTNAFTPTEKQARLSNINSVQRARANKRDSDSKDLANSAVRAIYGGIIDGDTDITKFSRLILSDPNITDEDKRIAIDQVRSFYTSWNSAIKDEDGDEIVTLDSTRIKALRIIKAVKTGTMTEERGLEVYGLLSRIESVNGTDSKQFINDIFAAGEAVRNMERLRQNEILAEREKQLRDAIEKQQNILQPELATEILKDFANRAVIELNDAFREGEFKKEEVDAEVDRLLRVFTLSELQQNNAVNARSLRLARSLKEQQESITKIVTSLRSEGKEDEARIIMDEAITLGIFTSQGGEIKKNTGKKKDAGEVLKRILDSIVE